MNWSLREVGFILLVLAGTVPAVAQVQFGDVSLSGTGGVSVGYAAESNDQLSSHSMEWGGQTTFNGYYYDPAFLNFSVVPYYNQSRANSDSASVANAAGVNADVNLFAGGRTPTSVSFSRAFNSMSSFNFGQPAFTSNGDSTTLGVSSTLLLNDQLPRLTFMYQQGDTNSDLFGSPLQLMTNYRLVNVMALYAIDGFKIHGGLSEHWSSSQVPNIVSNTTSPYDGFSQSYSASVSHAMPLQGSFNVGYDHETYNNDFQDGHNAGDYNLLNGNVSLHPAQHVQFNSNVNFTDNLTGVLQQSIVTLNGVSTIESSGVRNNSLTVSNSATYTGIPDIGLGGGYTYSQQVFAGGIYTAQSLDGEASYSHSILKGRFNSTFGVTKTIDSFDQMGYRSLNSWGRHFGAWGVNAGFNYSKTDRTQLIAYTTSGYSFSGSVNRKLGIFQWTTSGSESRSKFDQISESINESKSIAMNLSAKYGAFGGSYTTSTGNSILTSAGLTPVPLPPNIFLTSSIFFNGSSISGSGSFVPTSAISITGSYVHAQSSTALGIASSNNSTSEFDTRLTYRFHKLSFTAGYVNLHQGFSTSTAPLTSFTSYYFGIQRWFSFL